jgi:hypothetical protein
MITNISSHLTIPMTLIRFLHTQLVEAVNERRAQLLQKAEEMRASSHKLLGDDLCALSLVKQTASTLLLRAEKPLRARTQNDLVRALRLQDQLDRFIAEGHQVVQQCKQRQIPVPASQFNSFHLTIENIQQFGEDFAIHAMHR